MDLLLYEHKHNHEYALLALCNFFHQQPIKSKVVSDRKSSENIFSNKRLQLSESIFYTVCPAEFLQSRKSSDMFKMLRVHLHSWTNLLGLTPLPSVSICFWAPIGHCQPHYITRHPEANRYFSNWLIDKNILIIDYFFKSFFKQKCRNCKYLLVFIVFYNRKLCLWVLDCWLTWMLT